MVKVQRGESTASAVGARRAKDIFGLALFFLGSAALLSLCWSQQGSFSRGADLLLHVFAGHGAFVVPILLLIGGTMFLIGYERFSVSHSSYGLLTLFLVFVTCCHCARFPADRAGFDATRAADAGGVLGWAIGSLLDRVFGRSFIEWWFLVFCGLGGLVLLLDQPLVVFAQRMHERGRAGAEAAGRRIRSGTRAIPSRRRLATAGAAAVASGAAAPSGRSERAARVVERALAPVATAEPAPPAAPKLRLRSLLLGARSGRSGNESASPPGPDSEPGGGPAPEPAASDHNAVERPVSPGPRSARRQTSPPADSPAQQTALGIFVLPPLTLLKEAPPAAARRSQAELTDKVHVIEQTLEQFNIGANVVEVASGPSVTRYEIQLAPGIKVSKIVSLADNLAMSLAAIDVRVEAPIPGKSAIGVEVPNAVPILVTLRECLDTDEFRSAPSPLTIALGKDVAGQYKYADLSKMPHLLIGGSTNSGKSICLNTIIASLVFRATPRDVKLLMIDPKRVELSLWDGIPHLLHPVVKDVKQSAGLFRAALKEMDRRYDIFAALGTRNLEGYNQKVPENERLPYIVVIVDELADLMMQQGPEIETSICRLAQLARATGIHLVIATQRPSVDIITGTIKANISSRIAFAVASQVDSRTILDMNGADRLIGRGDMLFMPIDASKPIRIQGCYLNEAETNALVDYLKSQETPDYSFSLGESGGDGGRSGPSPLDDDEDDEFFENAVKLVVNNGQASTSMLQRRFRIGYTRAARIVEMMEERGIVGALNGAKPREILVSKDEVERMFRPDFIPGVDDYTEE